ncbi:hypothetical protein [Azospirillum canadense]|uniref:hypothetical protein n=1 Tax=Azospirillum canadense TaxID=403962 RepID=UPI0022265879|nr:hypothetical protein [Azospirillum canadense]MCW2242790.1 hypothetical protein [Azospirillum canadense]
MSQRLVTAALDAAGDPVIRKAAADATAATSVLSLPWWIDLVNYGYHGIMAAGAFALLVGRLVLMWNEIREKRQSKEG